MASEHEAAVLCYGDSNTWGYDAATKGRHGRHVRWPGVVRKLLSAEGAAPGAGGAGGAAALDVDIIEAGLNGRTTMFDDMTTGVCNRNGLTQLGPIALAAKPLRVVVIALGANDTKVYFGADARLIADGIRMLVLALRRLGVGPTEGEQPKILIVSPPPATDTVVAAFGDSFDAASVDKSRALGDAYEKVARELGCAILRGDRIGPDGGPLAVDPLDGLHFTADGHKALGEVIAKQLRALLAPAT